MRWPLLQRLKHSRSLVLMACRPVCNPECTGSSLLCRQRRLCGAPDSRAAAPGLPVAPAAHAGLICEFRAALRRAMLRRAALRRACCSCCVVARHAALCWAAVHCVHAGLGSHLLPACCAPSPGAGDHVPPAVLSRPNGWPMHSAAPWLRPCAARSSQAQQWARQPAGRCRQPRPAQPLGCVLTPEHDYCPAVRFVRRGAAAAACRPPF